MFITIKKETVFKILGVVVFVGIILFYLIIYLVHMDMLLKGQNFSNCPYQKMAFT